MFAIFPSLGFQEMFVLIVIGLLLYGRNLPEAGRTLGRVTAQLRRGFNEFKDQMNRDANVDEMKRTLQSTRDQIKQVAKVKRAVIDPTQALKDLTNATLSSSLPPEESQPEESQPDEAGDAGDDGQPDGTGDSAESSGNGAAIESDLPRDASNSAGQQTD